MAEVSGKNGGFVRAFGANDGQCVVNVIWFHGISWNFQQTRWVHTIWDTNAGRIGIEWGWNGSFEPSLQLGVYPLVIQHKYWKWPFIVSFPTKNPEDSTHLTKLAMFKCHKPSRSPRHAVKLTHCNAEGHCQQDPECQILLEPQPYANRQTLKPELLVGAPSGNLIWQVKIPYQWRS